MVDEPQSKRPRVEERIKGIAMIKPEYLINDNDEPKVDQDAADDEAEGAGLQSRSGDNNMGKKGKRGQNKARDLRQKREEVRFCIRDRVGESGKCEFGDNCRNEHDLSKYLSTKPPDIGSVCPVYAAIGWCPSGVSCRWLYSHFKDEALTEDPIKKEESLKTNYEVNRISVDVQHDLQRKRYDTSRSDKFIQRMDSLDKSQPDSTRKEKYADFFEGTLKPSEKKRLNYDGAKVLSPLTTVGNLPYRRLMKTLGADVTYSEMAMSLPLLQGSKSEWALPRAHSSEIPGFGVQISASKPWQAIKATQVLSELASASSEINLNCGCPIDLLYRQGAGSALLDHGAKILKILRGMNAVSNEIPVTVKLRMGVKDNKPTAKNIVEKLLDEEQAAAIVLHGRSRAQRYTKEANWDYIREVAETVRDKRSELDLKPWIIGNGDIFSWEDWYDHLEKTKVDTCMIARGALIKPWIFEEIDSKQYLDKSASERLEYIKQYVNFGLQHWGSDLFGVNQTRRFLCEWLSFTHRYVPVGLLEYLPPKLNDRPPAWKGRNDLETLLGSRDYRDWIKISEMFLGPAPETFVFEPKHKSNSYN